MPTIVSHAMVAVTAGTAARLSRRVILYGALLSVLPDIDVLGLPLGIGHYDLFGHRGFTHSLCFALLAAAIATAVMGRATTYPVTATRPTFVFLFVCTASHGMLDAMTNGGAGIAFFSPFSNERYFFPWTPLEVSPIGWDFFSGDGLLTLVSEGIWLGLPCAAVWFLTTLARSRRSGSDG